MRLIIISDSDIQAILKLISEFLRGNTNILSLNIQKKAKIVYYYNEIIRFWNKINFIAKRSLKNVKLLDSYKLSAYLLATYRLLWENASEKTIANELQIVDKKFLKTVKTFSWDKALINKDKKEKTSILEAIPSFMIEHLSNVMDIEFLKSNINYMDGLTNKIEITVRINILHGNYSLIQLLEQMMNSFHNEGIKFHSDSNIPGLLWIPRSQKKKVMRNSFYKNKQLIFQDKASTAIIQVLSPKRKDKILDMCAAPGIKTSLIAQFMNNQGHIIAGDFDTERIWIMKSLLSEYNILNVHLINTDSILFPIRYQNYFDCILLDAPCTGSGTFLANPELKWRQNEKFLHQNLVLQKKLIRSALDLLKTNGILVYSTCSLYPEEGEYQILDIISQLKPMDLPKWFSPSYRINNDIIPGTGRLFPSIHHTHGFFIGKFKKKN